MLNLPSEDTEDAIEKVIEEMILDESELDDSQVNSKQHERCKKRKVSRSIDDKINSILDDLIRASENKGRNASFGAYFVDRMEMPPLNVERE